MLNVPALTRLWYNLRFVEFVCIHLYIYFVFVLNDAVARIKSCNRKLEIIGQLHQTLVSVFRSSHLPPWPVRSCRHDTPVGDCRQPAWRPYRLTKTVTFSLFEWCSFSVLLHINSLYFWYCGCQWAANGRQIFVFLFIFTFGDAYPSGHCAACKISAFNKHPF